MPQERFESENDLNRLEAALGSLAPAASRLDRDALLFHAGEIAARRRFHRIRNRLWPAVAASFAAIAIGEAFVIHHQSYIHSNDHVIVTDAPKSEPISPRQGDPSTIIRTEANSAAVSAKAADRADGFVILSRSQPPRHSLQNAPSWLGETEYERLRREVTTFGVDALPSSPSLAISSAVPNPQTPSIKPQTSADLLRHELSRLLDPGGSL